MHIALIPHPGAVGAVASQIEVDVTRSRNGKLELRYVVRGAIALIAFPAAAAPERKDELWKQTCFEAFVRSGQGDAYYEFNFAPSTQWAAYRFEAYRAGISDRFEFQAPHISAVRSDDRYELSASIDLPMLSRAADWRVGLSAVIETIGGEKSYWALAHPPGPADFHHGDAFSLVLPATEQK